MKKRGVANLMEHLIPPHHVTMSMFGGHSTGIKKEWCHAQERVIISLVFIDTDVTYCIVLKNLNAANCRPW